MCRDFFLSGESGTGGDGPTVKKTESQAWLQSPEVGQSLPLFRQGFRIKFSNLGYFIILALNENVQVSNV